MVVEERGAVLQRLLRMCCEFHPEIARRSWDSGKQTLVAARYTIGSLDLHSSMKRRARLNKGR